MRIPDSALISSRARRVSLVNLQKFTLKGCELAASMKMLAPAENMRSRSEVTTSACTSGWEKRRRWMASASSMSTARS